MNTRKSKTSLDADASESASPVPAPLTPPRSATVPARTIEPPAATAPPAVPAASPTADVRDAFEGPFVKAKFEGLVLVCDQCEKRGSGPSKLTAKEARKTLKGALGAQRTRLRIVASSCLGLCPKKSIAIAAASRDAPAVLAEVRNERDLKAVAARLTDPRRGG